MPIPNGTFPDRMSGFPTADKLFMHHIKVKNKPAVMEELRRQCIDEGSAYLTTDETWEQVTDLQSRLDSLQFSDPDAYEGALQECTLREVLYRVNNAIHHYKVEQRDYQGSPKYPDMLDRILDCLYPVGLRDDQAWVAFLTEKYVDEGPRQEKQMDRMGRYTEMLMQHDQEGRLQDPKAVAERNAIFEEE